MSVLFRGYRETLDPKPLVFDLKAIASGEETKSLYGRDVFVEPKLGVGI